MPHHKVAQVAPALTPGIPDNPLVLFSLAHDGDGMVPPESLAVCECAPRVLAQSTRIYHCSHGVTLHQLALYCLTVPRRQLPEP